MSNDKTIVSPITSDDIWKRFIHLVAVETFGETEVLMKGKKIGNLLGSVEWHPWRQVHIRHRAVPHGPGSAVHGLVRPE